MFYFENLGTKTPNIILFLFFVISTRYYALGFNRLTSSLTIIHITSCLYSVLRKNFEFCTMVEN